MAKGDAKSSLILMGRIGAAHGIKGEVRIVPFTEDPLALAGYGALETNRPGLAVTITEARLQKNLLVAHIKGVSDRTAAEKLNGVELYLDRARLPEPEDEDDFYLADLIGLEARLADGSVLGQVLAVPNFGAGDLLEIGDRKTGRAEYYPFTKAVVPEIHISQGYLVVEPPPVIEDDEEEGEQGE